MTHSTLASGEVTFRTAAPATWPVPLQEQVVRALVSSCAEIEDFTVHESLQRQGIGTAMLEEAGRRSLDRGIDRIGLGLGYPDARRLYERRGFRLVPRSEHRVSWMSPDGHGGEREDHDDCVYLEKELS